MNNTRTRCDAVRAFLPTGDVRPLHQVVLCLATAAGGAMMGSNAATLDWVGPLADGNWSTATNWVENQSPTSGDSLMGLWGSTCNDLNGVSLHSVQFIDGGAGSTNVAGCASIHLQSGGQIIDLNYNQNYRINCDFVGTRIDTGIVLDGPATFLPTVGAVMQLNSVTGVGAVTFGAEWDLPMPFYGPPGTWGYGGEICVVAPMTYAGPTRISDYQRVSVRAGGALPSDSAVNVIGVLRIAGSASLASLSIDSIATVAIGTDGTASTNPASVLSVGADNSNSIFLGRITGPGGFTKVGTGTLTLDGLGDYAGPTTVTAGRLDATGVIDSAIVVGPGATLGGTGTVNSVSVESGGFLAPGVTAVRVVPARRPPSYSLTTAGITLASGSTLVITLNGIAPSSQYTLHATGALDLGGAALSLSWGYLPTAGSTFTILSADGGVTGTFSTIASPGVEISATYNSNSVVLTVMPSMPVGDFDGDGRADILWRNSSDGSILQWLMNGTLASQQATLVGAGGTRQPKFLADFDGDGKADILWQDSDGSTWLSLMDGVTILSDTMLVGGGTGWSVTQVGDFDGNGKADLVWTHTSGAMQVWLMNGASAISAASFVPAGTGWSVIKLADLDGDGKSDIIWQHTDGTVQAWLMNGLTPSSLGSFVGAGAWTVALAADLDGDGKDDLIWSNTDGSVQAWLMNGLTATQVNWFVMPPAAYAATPTAAGDLDGNGTQDILWRYADGTVIAWLMGPSLAVNQIASFTGTGNPWVVTHVRDFDGDGKADLLWRHPDGTVQMWLMNGLSVSSAAVLAGAGPYDVVPPMP